MITPFYERDGITVYCGDCYKIVPQLDMEFDTLIIDPPYGINENTKRYTARRSNLTASIDFPAVAGDDRPFDPAPWLGYSRAVLWGANYFADKLPIVSSWLVWDKRNGVASDDNADCELAWSNLGGPARLFSHLWKGCIKASERNQGRVHPTQKPVALMRWCIKQAKPKGVILDAFSGSGPVPAAAHELGYQCVAIELHENYCLEIVDRLRQPSFWSIRE